MANISERMRRLERQGIGQDVELTISTRESGEAKYYQTINGEEIEITEAEHNRLAKSAKLTEIVFKFTEEPEEL